MSKRTAKIKYLKSYDYKVSLATGVYGGISTNGLINANFFVDRVIIPKYQTIVISGPGEPIEPPIEEKDADIAREVLFGVLFDINSARIVTEWLQSKIKEYDDSIQRTKNK